MHEHTFRSETQYYRSTILAVNVRRTLGRFPTEQSCYGRLLKRNYDGLVYLAPYVSKAAQFLVKLH